jgi:hypothetical protein
MPNPSRATRYQKQTNQPLAENDVGRTWERCTTINVYPDTFSCDVYTEKGRMLSGLPFPSGNYDPSSGAGEISIPKRGMILTVHYGLGEPTLSFTQPVPQSGTQVPASTVTAAPNVGGEDGTYSDQGHTDYRGLRPNDIIAGDWIRLGTQGNLIGVLEGGLTILKASEVAQIIASKINDSLRLIGRNMDIFTDFGEFRFTNNNGNCSMQLRAGSKQTTQSSPSEQNYTIRADLGDAGQLVNFRITDPDGHILSSIVMDPNGSTTRVATGDAVDIVNGNLTQGYGSNKDTTIEGDESITVGGDSMEQVAGDKTIQASADLTLQSGNDIDQMSNRDISVGAGRNMDVSVSGDTTATPGTNALTYTVTNGTVYFDIGDPAAGDSQSAMSGWGVTTLLGDMTFSTTGGNFIVNTTIPNSVQLGGDSPLFHSMLFEMFQTFISTLGALIDSHTHLTPAGPSGPPIVPPYASSESLVPDIQSDFVTHGG